MLYEVITDSLFFRYNRWLNSDYAPYMTNRIEVYDGTTWQTVWETGGQPPVEDASWISQNFDITAYKNAAMQIRFGFTIGSSQVFIVSSWNT